jgi:hypothetical protein
LIPRLRTWLGVMPSGMADTTAPNTAECQSFLNNLIAQFGTFESGNDPMESNAGPEHDSRQLFSLFSNDFPKPTGNSTRHGREMEHEFCRLRPADFQDERKGRAMVRDPDLTTALLNREVSPELRPA